jgi:hypothetical protein
LSSAASRASSSAFFASISASFARATWDWCEPPPMHTQVRNADARWQARPFGCQKLHQAHIARARANVNSRRSTNIYRCVCPLLVAFEPPPHGAFFLAYAHATCRALGEFFPRRRGRQLPFGPRSRTHGTQRPVSLRRLRSRRGGRLRLRCGFALNFFAAFPLLFEQRFLPQVGCSNARVLGRRVFEKVVHGRPPQTATRVRHSGTSAAAVSAASTAVAAACTAVARAAARGAAARGRVIEGVCGAEQPFWVLRRARSAVGLERLALGFGRGGPRGLAQVLQRARQVRPLAAARSRVFLEGVEFESASRFGRVRRGGVAAALRRRGPPPKRRLELVAAGGAVAGRAARRAPAPPLESLLLLGTRRKTNGRRQHERAHTS